LTISIRLDPETEDELRRRLDAQGEPLSRFVREAIREKLARNEAQDTHYALGESLFGRFQSGETDRSVRRKALIRERLHDRHRR
jgi:predicted DNA-binding protein